jgi:hypothetical protein
MVRKRLAIATVTAALGIAALAGPVTAASNASCTGQFTSGLAPFVVPFGEWIVVPEVRNLTLGGPNFGQEVEVFFATADRDACPVTP